MASGKNESNKGLSHARPIEENTSGGHNNIGVALVFFFSFSFIYSVVSVSGRRVM